MRLSPIPTTASILTFAGVVLITGCTTSSNQTEAHLSSDQLAQVQAYLAQRDERQQRLNMPSATSAEPQADPQTPTQGETQVVQLDPPGPTTPQQPEPALASQDTAVDPAQRHTPADTSTVTVRQSNADERLYGELPGIGADPADRNDAASNLNQITFTEEGDDFDPEIDPTGQFVVYASTRHRQTSDIYLKRVGGSAVMQLTDDPGNDMMPSFSPDGRFVTFCSDRSGNWDIYILDTQGTGVARQITRSAAQEIHPTFSPDGTQLVFSAYGTQSQQWELVVINLDGPPTPRFIGYGLNPVWSPIDNHILFQRARERGTRWFSVWTCQLDENGDAIAFTELASSSNAAVITPDWSPDGQWVTFATVLHTSDEAQPDAPYADIWLMSADGAGRTRLTGGRFANLQPSWSPNGNIYFVTDRAQTGVDNIWSLQPDYALQLAERSLRGPGGAESVLVPIDNGTRTADVPVPLDPTTP